MKIIIAKANLEDWYGNLIGREIKVKNTIDINSVYVVDGGEYNGLAINKKDAIEIQDGEGNGR